MNDDHRNFFIKPFPYEKTKYYNIEKDLMRN